MNLELTPAEAIELEQVLLDTYYFDFESHTSDCAVQMYDDDLIGALLRKVEAINTAK